uniref:YKT6 v-SNARE homolog n=1 Tax=Anser brachyrhynchus TaxID=132585 RepID=A0A8B9CMB3_9AVES
GNLPVPSAGGGSGGRGQALGAGGGAPELPPPFPTPPLRPEYLCHVYVRSDGLAGVVIADNEYPQRVCFTLLDKVLDEFSRQVSRAEWPSGSPGTISYAALDGYLSKYQNPRDADPMTRVQAELDETKIILHNTMESLLERGEKLDDLVSKSEVLGAQSKAFYKTARKQNSCCAVM